MYSCVYVCVYVLYVCMYVDTLMRVRLQRTLHHPPFVKPCAFHIYHGVCDALDGQTTVLVTQADGRLEQWAVVYPNVTTSESVHT